MTSTKIITADPPRVIEFINPVRMVLDLLSRRDLIAKFAWRDVVGRYKGTYLGMIWSLLNPLMTLAVYTFVFGVILKARFTTGPSGGYGAYALILFSGIIVFNVFSVCISRASLLIADNPNYVKRVVFPLEILPVAALGSSLISAGLGLIVLIPALVIFSAKISSTMYIFPLIILPLCALTLGLAWFLASFGVYIRDVGQVVTVLLQLLFFVSPVIYPLSAVPERFQLLARVNPLTTILENARRTLVWGQSLEWRWWVVVTIGSLLFMQFGYIWFMRTKRTFADVI
jgi:lipopolysaccharide transport system permease protein